MLQNLRNFVEFQKIQLDNLVDFAKCCKARIYLQRSVPIQPKTSNIWPKFCQKLATTTLRVAGDQTAGARLGGGDRARRRLEAGRRSIHILLFRFCRSMFPDCTCFRSTSAASEKKNKSNELILKFFETANNGKKNELVKKSRRF